MSLSSLHRFTATLGRTAAAATLSVIVGASAVLAQDEASPAPSGSPEGTMASAAPGESMAPTYPLPEIVAVIPPDIPTVSLEPESTAPGAEVGVPMPFTLEHCGLLSPVDVDGSFWQPVSGSDATGGPIESDDAIGELINATPGELLLTSDDAATSPTAMASQIQPVRAQGAVDYPLCM
jgi:hypothetical protein